MFEPAWEALVADNREPSGYGLYTYVLIRQKPQTADEFDTALRVIERLLHATDAIFYVQQTSRAEINLFMIPVRSTSYSYDTRKQAEEILARYNHARARKILNRIGETTNGIYFVSSLRPIGSGRNTRVLVQRLSGARRMYIANWVDYFVQKASAPSTWKVTTLREALLNTRDYLDAIGTSAEPVANNLRRIIKFVSDISGGNHKTGKP
jgi:hypothetical protein